MIEILDVIRKRRSVRKYQPRPVQDKLVKEVLTAAGWAPSAHNAQPWRFIILPDVLVKRELAEAMAESWASDFAKDGLNIEPEMLKFRVDRFASAPVLIIACLSMDGMDNFSDEKRQKIERDLAMQSVAAALENIMLAAHAEGLGACWYCAPAFCRETVRKVLGIPADAEPQALIAMGYPAEAPIVPNKKQLGDFCFKNKWGSKF